MQNNDKTGDSIYFNGRNGEVSLKPLETTSVAVIPVAKEVFFPEMHIGHNVSNPITIEAVREAQKSGGWILFLFTDNPEITGHLGRSALENQKGVLAKITEVNESPSGELAIVADIQREVLALKVEQLVPYIKMSITDSAPTLILPSKKEAEKAQKLEMIYECVTMHLQEESRKQLNEAMSQFAPDSVGYMNFMIQNSPLTFEERLELLNIQSLEKRRDKFIEFLELENENLMMRAELHQKTMEEIGNRQREDFLRTQMRQIKSELGETADSDEETLIARSLEKEWTEEAEKHFNKELHKMLMHNPTSPDYAVQYTYLDTFLNLPWLHCDNNAFEIDKAEEILERDHYGLEKVKERILEQISVLKLRGDTKAPILCLYGPPGVGKTSLGKSIAEAMGRKYVRVALGGVHDEAEIRGHRKTYIGSMPGRIISALAKCGTNDPVMVLDEIDKIGADHKGDPSQALLEVLDPEQNCKFHDNYVDFDYDLSKVVFIATANTLQTISAPLLDRMELIEIGGYVNEEKIEIAKRHLIAKALEENGFGKNEIKFKDDALLEIINSYTRESGVRQLEKKIQSILRKIARLKASGKKYPKTVSNKMVGEFLGKPIIFANDYENNDLPGVVTGLAWTQAGGDILFIESSIAPGKEGKLTLTGNLGDVMKESAVLGLQYVKSNHKKLGIDEKSLEFGTVHIHVPEGAVPKDGPSAGITIVTSLVSSFTGRKVRSRIAMTGEMTLRGKVLPVGGIKEKVLAAKRAGIDTIVMCAKNRKDVEEIKPEYLEGLSFHYVDTVDEVLDFALLP